MLKGKTVVVTGSGRGIGKCIAVKFAKEGSNIVLNDINDVSSEVIDEIKSYGVECIAIKASVSDFEDAKKLINGAKEAFGSVDVLVNNAGITKDMLVMRMSEEDFRKVIDVNLVGAFNTIRFASNIMLKQKEGAIINMASVVGRMGNIGQANYAASKAGIIGLTKSVAKELGMRGITCNALAPGFIQTDMTAVLSEDVKKQMLAAIPLKRMGTPDDVADACLFFAKNRYITGQVLNVDGGLLM